MNTQAFSSAKSAYQQGDWAGAVASLAAAKAPGELWGEADHLRGNALMKLGMFVEAAEAYAQALADPSYEQGHVGALSCNRGRALVAAGLLDAAVPCFEAAVADASYPTPYKAYLALGNLYSRKGMAREAGCAWRNAAIDEANPDPSGALVKLGGCFMTLGRPVDAVEAYRTALDFSSDASQGPIYAELGQAYMAANRVAEAADAFTQATSDGSYQLTPEQSVSYTAAQKALAAMQGGGPSETDQMLSQAGYGSASQQAPQQGGFDPLDPMGKSGEFIPSPEDTGFFSVTEEDLMRADKHERKVRRKHSRIGLKIFAVLVVLIIIVGGVGGFAYYKGYGWPMQEQVVSEMFSAAASGADISGYLAEGVSTESKTQIQAILPTGGTAEVTGVDRSMSSSQVLVSATLTAGGAQSYTVSLVRDGISWKVASVELQFASQTSGTTTTTGTLTGTGAASDASATTSSLSATTSALSSPAVATADETGATN